MRFAAHISSPDLIVDERRARMPEVYAPEPKHGWCYYFEKADLARQFDDWEEVVNIGDTAFKLDDDPRDPSEWFVFIEGYAHVGEWVRALELSQESYRASQDDADLGRLLCQLWERIETETTESRPQLAEGVERSKTLSEVKSIFACNP
jgi:hypothetical protein